MVKEKVDNFDLIRPLLKWENEGDYYLCSLILRKKDKTTTFGNKNNSARLIKSYHFYNVEQYDQKKEEIIKLCDLFGCRAGIALNKKNNEKTAVEILRQITEKIISKNFIGINGLLNTVNGQSQSLDKYWLIDCDSEEEYQVVKSVLESESIKPEGEKILAVMPSYNGKHVLTRKFDRKLFDIFCSDRNVTVEIHKNNFFCLYYPQKEE